MTSITEDAILEARQARFATPTAKLVRRLVDRAAHSISHPIIGDWAREVAAGRESRTLEAFAVEWLQGEEDQSFAEIFGPVPTRAERIVAARAAGHKLEKLTRWQWLNPGWREVHPAESVAIECAVDMGELLRLWYWDPEHYEDEHVTEDRLLSELSDRACHMVGWLGELGGAIEPLEIRIREEN